MKDKIKEKEYCIDFISEKLKEALNMKKDILEELTKNNKARYSVKMGHITGTISFKEEKEE